MGLIGHDNVSLCVSASIHTIAVNSIAFLSWWGRDMRLNVKTGVHESSRHAAPVAAAICLNKFLIMVTEIL